MKQMKKNMLLLIFFLIVINNASAQKIDFDISGVYLPVEYIETLERTKHNPISWASLRGKNYYHTVYIVSFHSIQSCGLYDGIYEIELIDIFVFKFEKIGEDAFLTDNNNNRYKKIPGELYEFEYKDWSSVVNDFISKIILDELIKNGDITLENGIITIPALDNKKLRIEWQAYDPRRKYNLEFENIDNFLDDISLEIRQNEYVFLGYINSSIDIVWSKCYDTTDIYPKESDFYGVWINDLDVKHIISANEWTFVSPNGNTYTMSNLKWTKLSNYNITFISETTGVPYSTYYKYGYSISGTVSSYDYHNSHYLFIGFPFSHTYFIHENDKTKKISDGNPIKAAFFRKISE